MKRTDLMKTLRASARSRGLEMSELEGGKHTKVMIGEVWTTIPRHREINEHTAKAILDHLGVTT
jgi:mRNA interferase HicA